MQFKVNIIVLAAALAACSVGAQAQQLPRGAVRVRRVGVSVGAERGGHQPTMLHPLGGQELIGRALDTPRGTAHDDHLQAMVVVEVDVQRRHDGPAEVVLHLREALGELAHVVVVDEGERRHDHAVALKVGLHELGPQVRCLGLQPDHATHGLEGDEVISIAGIEAGLAPKKQLTVKAGDKTFTVIARIDTPQEVEYVIHGGTLQYVLRQRTAAGV